MTNMLPLQTVHSHEICAHAWKLQPPNSGIHGVVQLADRFAGFRGRPAIKPGRINSLDELRSTCRAWICSGESLDVTLEIDTAVVFGCLCVQNHPGRAP